ncbi:MAG TPA: hemerythrin domain-containing protein [Kofleriaceae bacterium]|nr:hemerythrin domain-containing protein [Kofleriaceae bacterium]
MATTFPSDVHLRLSEEHARIRVMLAQIEAKAAAAEETGERAAIELASLLSRLAVLLAAHNANEEAALRPLLAQADAWAAERVDAMVHDHVAEHAALRAMIEPLKDLLDLDRLRTSALVLVAHLRDHLEGEERAFLNRKVLHDDLVTSGEDG